MSKQIKDITNQKFGRLTALKFIERKDNRTYWKCICSCGKYKIVRFDALKFGYTQSCGCIIKESAKQRGLYLRKPIGYSLFEKIYTMYIRNAKKRNLQWKLNKEEVKFLTQQNCYYCNDLPSTNVNPPKIWTKEWKTLNVFKYNGIDRLDNNIGYLLTNCVSCCKICNRAKKDLTIGEFNTWINRLVKYNKGSVENEA